MLRFPKGVYSDVRTEHVSETKIVVKNGVTEELKKRTYKAAFIRLFDGHKWFLASIDDESGTQQELDGLYALAKNSSPCRENIKGKYRINKGEFMTFSDDDISRVEIHDKENFLKIFLEVVSKNHLVKNWSGLYQDKRAVKKFMSTLGTDIVFDVQNCGIKLNFTMTQGANRLTENFSRGGNSFGELEKDPSELEKLFEDCSYYVNKVKPVKSGTYKVILSPFAAGIFAHESFGHKSEADFMLGDKKMAEEWQIGKKIASDSLSIVDDGGLRETGFTPYDDEGTPAQKTYLIKNGILSGRLHSVETAADLGEEPTGNARAVSYAFEPIVRMTNTYIEPGKTPKKELFKNAGEAILIQSVKHGSGLSTFTLAPNRSYLVSDGEIAQPVNVSVLTGNVFKTLSEIEDLSEEAKIFSSVGGGCGKNDQYPLPVSFGGPYTTVSKMNVQ
ncbi:TldD/PmbA family protein [candidate division WOR-3 bacterium]|nr:TldD/PmbA family protein [candidate division WOR-3 bacterium]